VVHGIQTEEIGIEMARNKQNLIKEIQKVLLVSNELTLHDTISLIFELTTSNEP
jgi:hypothetical protein